MSYNELQYWRTRAERLHRTLEEMNEYPMTYDARQKLLAALSEAPPEMDADTARAWRESDGDHRNHVEDAIRALDAVRAAKLPLPLGVRVRKKSGSQWQGRVVGYYSASRTKNGIAVESEREIGNVQVYPAEAFELVPEDSQ